MRTPRKEGSHGRRGITPAAVALIGAVGLIGCGGKDEPAETPQERAAAAAEVEADFPPPTNDAERELLISTGKRAFASLRCGDCHVTGDAALGPVLDATDRSATVALEGGRTVPRDRLYLYRSLRHPKSEVAAGYEAKMPLYPQMTDDQVRALLVYLESL